MRSRLMATGVLALACNGGGAGDPIASSGDSTSSTVTGSTSGAPTTSDADSGSSSTGVDIPELDCGAPTFATGTGLRRHPYLQSISDTSARIAWTTTSGGVGTVRYAPSKDGPWSEMSAVSTVFEQSYTNDTEDYTAYDATLEGLVADSAYCYEIVEDGVTLASGLAMHTAWSGAHRPLRILAFGDSGDFSTTQLGLRDQMLTRDFDVFLHLGDVAYGDGTFSEFEERVFLAYRELLHRVPTYPALGNHEYKTNSGQPYLDVYYLWEMALQEHDQERYYSFDYGDVHFVAIDSNDVMLLQSTVNTEGTSMFDWLEADLAASTKPWKIAFFHHPPYSSSDREPNLLVRNGLLPYLENGGVDLVLAGHDHHYERTKAIYDGEAVLHEDGGIHYFVVGSGGAGLRAATGDWWTEVVNDENHAFLELTIEGCTALGRAIGIRGQVIDEFYLPGCDE